jgi:hypothetical protein
MRHLFLVYLIFISILQANEPVTLQLKWKHQFQFAGFYIGWKVVLSKQF